GAQYLACSTWLRVLNVLFLEVQKRIYVGDMRKPKNSLYVEKVKCAPKYKEYRRKGRGDMRTLFIDGKLALGLRSQQRTWQQQH
ncbi:mCG145646, partial [Mus musculus]